MSRLFDGIRTIEGGMNSGDDPSLIDVNQVAIARNITVRDSFAKTRPAQRQIKLVFDSQTTQDKFTGIFQGACFYQTALVGSSGFIVSVGGYLFRIMLSQDTATVTDVTPKALVITTSNFTVPSIGNSVTFNVNNEQGVIKSGDVIYIQSGEFLVTSVVQNQITATYLGGFTPKTVAIATTAIFDVPQPVEVVVDFTVPAAGHTVSVTLTSTTPFTVGQDIYMSSGQYTINSITGNVVGLTYVGSSSVGTVTAGTIVKNVGGVTYYSGNPVLIAINNAGTFIVTQTIYIASGQYTISVISGLNLTLTYAGGSTISSVPVGTPLTNNLNVSYTYLDYTILAGSTIEDSGQNPIYFVDKNPSDLNFVHLFQAENYAIGLAGQNSTTIFDGSQSRKALAGNQELPPAFIGAYEWGRIWLVLNDRRSFVAGDLIGSASGTAQRRYIDAILRMTENVYLNGGGSFAVPTNAGLISAIGAVSALDTSLGIGQIIVGTTNSLVGVNAPVDRTVWQNLTYPIQSVSGLGYGPVAPRFLTAVNSDLWYRAFDGIRSFIAKRRDFQQWVDSPQSRELKVLLENDSPELLFYASGCHFDNKLFGTLAPQLTPYGVVHLGLGVINFDLNSNLRKKLPPAWEGFYTGLQVFQVLNGTVDGVERAFAFALNGSTIELWEIKSDGNYDIYLTGDDICRTPIQSYFETRRLMFGDDTILKSLYTGELYFDEITDDVSVVIKYRPDQYEPWTEWTTLNFCANKSQCTLDPSPKFTCNIWKELSSQYAARVMLTTPTEVENPQAGGYLKDFYEMQFRFEITGHIRMRKFKVHAVTRSDRQEGEVLQTVCSSVVKCDLPYFDYDSHDGTCPS